MKSYITDLIIDCTQDRTDIDPNAPVTPRPNVPTAPVANPVSSSTPAPATNAPMAEPEPTLSPFSTTTSKPVSDVPIATTTSKPNTDAPYGEPTDPPTSSPVVQGQTPAPATVDQPSPSPVGTPAPTSPKASECELNNACNILGLTGKCCPTIDDWTLDCCNGGSGGDGNSTVKEFCVDNPKCAALDLVDSCCPTVEGWFLDCCESVPNECLQPGACEVYSALEYVALGSSAANAGNNQYFLLLLAAVYTVVVWRMM